MLLSISKSFELDEAQGLDSSLLNHLPELNFHISQKLSTHITIGKRYPPFVFVKEEMSLRNQMKKSSFYKLTLEQYWEEIYSCEINDGNKDIAILVDASDVQREVNFSGGKQVSYKESANGTQDEFIWFRAPVQGERKREVKFGLCSVVCEGMRSLQESRGWEENCEAYKLEENRSDCGWKKLCVDGELCFKEDGWKFGVKL